MTTTGDTMTLEKLDYAPNYLMSKPSVIISALRRFAKMIQLVNRVIHKTLNHCSRIDIRHDNHIDNTNVLTYVTDLYLWKTMASDHQ